MAEIILLVFGGFEYLQDKKISGIYRPLAGIAAINRCSFKINFIQMSARPWANFDKWMWAADKKNSQRLYVWNSICQSYAGLFE